MPAAKRSAYVAQEVDLGECTLTHSGFETQRRHHQKSKTRVPVAPKKDMCPTQTLKKIEYELSIMCQVKLDLLTAIRIMRVW